MKKLVLIRHGEAEWSKGFHGPRWDINKPLTSQGENDVKLKTEKVLKEEDPPDTFFISKAERASKTALIIKSTLNLKESSLSFHQSLYSFEWHKVLTFIRNINKDNNIVWLLGHNPALSEVTNYLSFDQKTFNLPTTGIAIIDLDINNWEEARKDCGLLKKFHYPADWK